MKISILDFEFSEWTEAKFWRHGISRRQIREMLHNRMIVTTNRKNRAADFMVIGRDDSGRCIATPILPTNHPAIWRPISAWYCKPSEAAKLR